MAEHVPRPVVMIGSYPAPTAEAAMRDMAELAGPYLLAMPDGETGERADYVRYVIEGLARDTTHFKTLHEGNWSTMEERTVLRPRRQLAPGDINLPYLRHALAADEAMAPMLDEYGLQIPQQVSVPSPLSLAAVAIGPRHAPIPGITKYQPRMLPATARAAWHLFRNYNAFAGATASVMERIVQALGVNRVLLQLEAPGETLMASKNKNGHRTVGLLGGSMTGLADSAPDGTQFGVHLCNGSLANKAAIRPDSLQSAVTLANVIARQWPAQKNLRYIHIPMATSDAPMPTGREAKAFLAPLKDLAVPEDTLVVAGLAHEGQSLQDQRACLLEAERLTGRRLGVAASCGLGRYRAEFGYEEPRAARDVVRRCVQLADTP